MFRPIGLRGAVRLALVGFVAALVLVLAVLPSRLAPWRTDREVSVSLAAPSPEDAAFLLTTNLPYARRPAAEVVALDDATATLIATGEVLRSATGERRTAYVSWEGYVLEHAVDRVALEQALGRPLTDADVKAPVYRAITYRSAWLPAYVAAEVLILGAVFTAGLLLARGVRLVFFWPAALVAWAALLGGAVLVFAPAVEDADFFYHRVVIDRMAVWVASRAVVAPLPAGLSALAGVGWVVGARFPERLHARMVGAAGVLALGFLGLYAAAYREGAAVLARVEAAVPCVAPVYTTWASAHPAPRGDADYAALADALAVSDWAGACAASTAPHENRPLLYVADGDQYVLFILGPYAYVGDRRPLDNRVGGEAVRWTRAAGAPARAPFPEWLRGHMGHYVEAGAGVPVRGPNGDEAWLVAVDFDP